MPSRRMQVGDERAHQPGLADAGGQGEAERREVPLEVGDGRELERMISSGLGGVSVPCRG